MPFWPSQPNASSLPAAALPRPAAAAPLLASLPHAADGLVDPQPQPHTSTAANSATAKPKAAQTMTHPATEGWWWAE